MQRREYQTTEFWAVAIGVILWLLDRHTGTNILDVLADGEAVTAAKAQVAIIAANLREATGSDSDVVIYGAMAIYVGRKLEKVVKIWRAGQ